MASVCMVIESPWYCTNQGLPVYLYIHINSSVAIHTHEQEMYIIIYRVKTLNAIEKQQITEQMEKVHTLFE